MLFTEKQEQDIEFSINYINEGLIKYNKRQKLKKKLIRIIGVLAVALIILYFVL